MTCASLHITASLLFKMFKGTMLHLAPPLFRRNDPERNAKLGVLKCMPDHIAGEIYLADYLLYRLNRPGPVESVRDGEPHMPNGSNWAKRESSRIHESTRAVFRDR